MGSLLGFDELWVGGSDWMRPLCPERDNGQGGWVPHCGWVVRTSCGRTSGRECCIPPHAAAAPRPCSSRRWTPPGGCGWAAWRCASGNGALPLPLTSRMRQGRKRLHGAGRDPHYLAQKKIPKDCGEVGGGEGLERNQKLGVGAPWRKALGERLGPSLTCCPHGAGC